MFVSLSIDGTTVVGVDFCFVGDGDSGGGATSIYLGETLDTMGGATSTDDEKTSCRSPMFGSSAVLFVGTPVVIGGGGFFSVCGEATTGLTTSGAGR